MDNSQMPTMPPQTAVPQATGMMPQSSVGPMAPSPLTNPADPEKKSKLPMVLAIIILLVLLVGGSGGAYYYLNYMMPTGEQASQIPSVAPTSTPDPELSALEKDANDIQVDSSNEDFTTVDQDLNSL